MTFRIVRGNHPLVKECSILRITNDPYYINTGRTDHRGRPIYIGITALSQIARELGFVRNPEVEAMEAEIELLRDAEQRWRQIFATLSSIGFNLPDSDRKYFDDLIPRLEEARARAREAFVDVPGDDKIVASSARISKQQTSKSGPLDLSDGASGESDTITLAL